MTSERGIVLAVRSEALAVRFDDGHIETLTNEQLDSAHLDHAYAVTVHRMQGATVDCAHVFADGGGRELTYVAMSRARLRSHAHVVADGVADAAEELVTEWRADRRQRWTTDVDDQATPGDHVRPRLVGRTTEAVRLARLKAERDAVAAVAPSAEGRLRALDLRIRLTTVAARPVPGRGIGRA